MAVSREQKVTSLTQYVDALKQSNGIILADYSGLKVSEVEKTARMNALLRPSRWMGSVKIS